MIWTGIVRALWKPVAALLGLLGIYVAGRRHARQRAKSEAATAKLKTIKEVQGYEREAETQDDDALVARLTRKP
jgi:xanthosine utilization system XapX-like protein